MSKAEIVPLIVDRSRLENTSDFTSWLRKLSIYDRKDIAEAFCTTLRSADDKVLEFSLQLLRGYFKEFKSLKPVVVELILHEAIRSEGPQATMTTRSILCFLKIVSNSFRSVEALRNSCFRVFESKKQHIVLNFPRSSARIFIVLNPWLWWLEMIVTVVVSATRDHGFESPALHEWLPPATPWTYMDSLGEGIVNAEWWI